jgi:hypothetical protein
MKEDDKKLFERTASFLASKDGESKEMYCSVTEDAYREVSGTTGSSALCYSPHDNEIQVTCTTYDSSVKGKYTRCKLEEFRPGNAIRTASYHSLEVDSPNTKSLT